MHRLARSCRIACRRLTTATATTSLALATAAGAAGATEPTFLPAAPVEVTLAEPVVAVDAWTFPGDIVDIVADGEGSAYVTLARGPILHVRLPDAAAGDLEMTAVTEPLTEARGIAIRDGVLYAVELGAFPCGSDLALCEGGDAIPGAEQGWEGELAILDAMRARVLAWDIGEDGTLGESRTVLADLPVVSSLHAANGLELGPDGLLYLPIGAVDRLWWAPEKVAGHTPHPEWIGTLLRFDGSGAPPEIVADGLRNVYDVAFDGAGRLWGVVNDGVAQTGYLAEELLQIKPGRHYGYPFEGTFGPKAIRDDEPLWVLDTNGTAGLAPAASLGLGEGLLVGDCGRVSHLSPQVTVPDDRWWQGVMTQPRRAVTGIAGCVTSLEQVGADRLLASTFVGTGAGQLLALTVAPPPPDPDATPRPKWQPPS